MYFTKSQNTLLLSVFILVFSFYSGVSNADDKNAIMLDKVYDPLILVRAKLEKKMDKKTVEVYMKSARTLHKADNYQQCIQNINYPDFEGLYESLSKKVTENKRFNDIEKATLIDDCPKPAIAQCEDIAKSEGLIDFYYVEDFDTYKMLGAKCEHPSQKLRKKWTVFTVISPKAEPVATITVDGVEHPFSSDQNCFKMSATSVSTDKFKNDKMLFQNYIFKSKKSGYKGSITYKVYMDGFKKPVPFKTVSSDVQYADDVITGTAKMQKIVSFNKKSPKPYIEAANKIKETADITFKINCK